jgi:hypothetical protein
MFRIFIVVLASLSLVACTNMQAIDASRPQSVRGALKVGDEVSVVARNGKTYLLMLTTVDDEKIVGTGDNKKVTIRYEQIQSIEVRKVSTGKTAAAIGGTALAIGALLLVTVFVLFKASGNEVFGGN